MFPAFEALQGKRVILASESPRRLDIFRRAGFVPETMTSGFPENLSWRDFEKPSEYVSFNSGKKVEFLIDSLALKKEKPSLIIGCDTVIACDGVVLEKASSRQHAFEMMQSFSGKILEIHSGVTVSFRSKDGSYTTRQFNECTEIHMRHYDDAMIDGYLSCLDNIFNYAGALAIQEAGIVLVEKISGDFYNAVGFPISKFYEEMRAIVHLID